MGMNTISDEDMEMMHDLNHGTKMTFLFSTHDKLVMDKAETARYQAITSALRKAGIRPQEKYRLSRFEVLRYR